MFDEAVQVHLKSLKKTDEPEIKDKSILQTVGVEGQVAVVKNDTGGADAYQYTNSNWVNLGLVISSPKKILDNVEYDFVFDVDAEEGKPPLKLGYSKGEDIYVAAERFMKKFS